MNDAHSIKWLCRPDRLRFERIAWADCPRFIRKAFSRWKALYEFAGDHALSFVFDDRWLFRVCPRQGRKHGPVCDLASIPWWLPPMLVSRNTMQNHLDLGALVHDLLHLGCVRFPGVRRRREQARLADAVMLALWRDCLGEDAGWWQRTRLTRKWVGVRAAAPFLFRPQNNPMPDWITITDLETETTPEIDHD